MVTNIWTNIKDIIKYQGSVYNLVTILLATAGINPNSWAYSRKLFFYNTDDIYKTFLLSLCLGDFLSRLYYKCLTLLPLPPQSSNMFSHALT